MGPPPLIAVWSEAEEVEMRQPKLYAAVCGIAALLMSACTTDVHDGDTPPTSTNVSRVVVPMGSSSVVITSGRPIAPVGPRSTRVTLNAEYDRLVDVLSTGLRQRLPGPTCNGGGHARGYRLVFRYAARPTITIVINPDCRPGIRNNLGVQADNLAAVRTIVNRLSGLPPRA